MKLQFLLLIIMGMSLARQVGSFLLMPRCQSSISQQRIRFARKLRVVASNDSFNKIRDFKEYLETAINNSTIAIQRQQMELDAKLSNLQDHTLNQRSRLLEPTFYICNLLSLLVLFDGVNRKECAIAKIYTAITLFTVATASILFALFDKINKNLFMIDQEANRSKTNE